MTTTMIDNSYLVKVSTWGEGVKIAQNSVHVVCTCPYGIFARQILANKQILELDSQTHGRVKSPTSTKYSEKALYKKNDNIFEELRPGSFHKAPF